MEKQQRFCVSSSRFAAKKIQNSNKRKERDHQEAESEVFAGLRSQSSSAVSSIVSSRTPGRVLKEPRLSNDNWVNKMLTLLVVIREVMNENPSWVKKPETSATISAIADSRIPGRVSKELKLFMIIGFPRILLVLIQETKSLLKSWREGS
ncbi:hypothetical protein Peur_004100 [Populus x canadensis]